MLDRSDNQDVGLEAAIIERVRNSSLVEWSSAENPTGLKPGTEALGPRHLRVPVGGRGAFHAQRRWTVRTAGVHGSANAGTSSEMRVRNVHTECLRFPEEG